MEQNSSATSPAPAAPQHLLRVMNAARVLQYAWDTEAFTASDAIEATGLTRSTVLSVCADLVDRHWIHELDDARTAGQYSLGRPARRYAFRADAGSVVAVDAGQHRITVRVTNLRGVELSRAGHEIDEASDTAADRMRVTTQTVEEALTAADERGSGSDSVLAAVFGVPAPTDENGRSPAGEDDYWARMNPDFAEVFARRGWTVVVENDANLAAIAEGAVGAGVGTTSFVSLLAGERFGAGIISGGSLVRGATGGAGELHLLDLVEGVGSADGLASLARQWAADARASGSVAAGGALATAISAEQVFAAARAGDLGAQGIADRLAVVLARVCAVVGGMLDAERIIVGGAVAPAAEELLARASEHLAAFAHGTAPALVASPLGGDAVVLGAVERGLALVRAEPLAFDIA